MWKKADQTYMQRALLLAGRGLGKTWPNPLVGAVLVKNGRVVGEGWHQRYGGPHAETHAIRQAGRSCQEATLYVNLEPCAHYGHTPPCALAVAAAGIKRVVCSMRDPNPKVAGKGFAILRKAGIQVEIGLLRPEARRLNRVFLKLIASEFPYVANKMALSLDGKIACFNGKSRWISSVAARKYAHVLRGLAGAVAVGARTAIQDDPQLNVRTAARPLHGQPLRVIVAGNEKLPRHLKMFATAREQRVLIAASHPAAGNYPPGVEQKVLPGAGRHVDLPSLLRCLRDQGICYLLVEGGADLHAAFLGLGPDQTDLLSDEVHMILAPKIIGGRNAPGPVGGRGSDDPEKALLLQDRQWRMLGPDLLVVGRPIKPRMKKG